MMNLIHNEKKSTRSTRQLAEWCDGLCSTVCCDGGCLYFGEFVFLKKIILKLSMEKCSAAPPAAAPSHTALTAAATLTPTAATAAASGHENSATLQSKPVSKRALKKQARQDAKIKKRKASGWVPAPTDLLPAVNKRAKGCHRFKVVLGYKGADYHGWQQQFPPGQCARDSPGPPAMLEHRSSCLLSVQPCVSKDEPSALKDGRQ